MTPNPRLRKISDSIRRQIAEKRSRRATESSLHSFTRMIPNIATVLALCSGLTSMRFSFEGDFRMAVTAILLAAVFDLMDGRLARMLGAASEFGAELDSLSDFVSFGTAPALVLYMASLHHLAGLGWGVCLFFAVCAGFRLARFNILTRIPTTSKVKSSYFVGVPAPMGAIITLIPFTFFFAIDLEREFWPTSVFMIITVISGLLMISKIPTFSSKTLVIKPEWRGIVFLASGLLLASLYTAVWLTLFVSSMLYVCSIPLFYWQHKKTLILEQEIKSPSSAL